MATMGAPCCSQSLTVVAKAEVTITNGPYAGVGAWANRATKKWPVGVGYCGDPTTAGAWSTSFDRSKRNSRLADRSTTTW